jgi:hypothetical protein
MMASKEKKIGNKNQRARRLSSGFYICIPIIQLHSILICCKLISKCLLVCIFFLHYHIASPCPNTNNKKVGSYLSDYLSRLRTLPCMYFYHIVLFHDAIDQLPSVLDIWCDPKANNIVSKGLAKGLACFPSSPVWLVS